MQQDELIGAILGNYRIIAPLGQGGMARVYRAYQENLDREVAIKVLPPWYAADRNFVERFQLEARLVARLSHPNIVTVHDANEVNGHLYIVMQLVDGGTLRQRLDQLPQRQMAPAEVIAVFVPLADALAYAHDQGIIHRDIKPVNVLMDRARRPILSDFGIAKVLASTQENLTRPGAGVGTPEYMSPEQCHGGPVDHRADIYALGVLLFEAMTGRPPFQGDTYPALAHSHIYEPPPRPSALNSAINPYFEQVVLKALMKDPQHRYQSTREMALALQAAYQQTLQGRVSGPSPAIGRLELREAAPPLSRPPAKEDAGLNAQSGLLSPSSPAEAMHFCPNCHAYNRAQTRFCTRCGHVLNPCPACGKQNMARDRFCTRCGQPLMNGYIG
jgi:serine/threonine protein kinase